MTKTLVLIAVTALLSVGHVAKADWVGPEDVRRAAKALDGNCDAFSKATAAETGFTTLTTAASNLAASAREVNRLVQFGEERTRGQFRQLKNDFEAMKREFHRCSQGATPPSLLLRAAWTRTMIAYERLDYVMQESRQGEGEWHRP